THLVFNFEAEKYYYLDYEIIKKHILASGGVRFFITEITDAIQLIEVQERASMERAEAKARFEKQESFLAYQRSNPNLLEGIWKGETKRLKNTFYLQYTFNGDKMTFEGKSKHAGMKPYVMEGRLIFSENTIVLLVEKVTENGKEQKNFKTKYIWYYTLIDDVLHLEGGNTAGGGALIWETNGEFRKTR
ncbi:MAG: hypothetical protein FWE56_06035, partial [Candidatus Bathyarchaeota archaeon]|nr:hypothetical protein [Candidatus Termiticorpusculum sp.]